ncbi:MAG TPA: hypothetical protein VMA73_24605 [Streptosporangiaceae bacterium]|nr:hypothetical protein [Streptosporangiaceae bacterium]
MGLSTALGTVAHDAMHRVPGMPDHARKGQLNEHQHQPGLRNSPLRNRPLGNRSLRDPDGRHGRPPRVFAGWQAWLGQRFRNGQR